MSDSSLLTFLILRKGMWDWICLNSLKMYSTFPITTEVGYIANTKWDSSHGDDLMLSSGSSWIWSTGSKSPSWSQTCATLFIFTLLTTSKSSSATSSTRRTRRRTTDGYCKNFLPEKWERLNVIVNCLRANMSGCQFQWYLSGWRHIFGVLFYNNHWLHFISIVQFRHSTY